MGSDQAAEDHVGSDDVQGDAEEPELEAEEFKCMPCPVLPTQAEIDAHNVTHLHFRS